MSSAPLLADIHVNGRPIKAVAVPAKQAFLFMFDRMTGQPVWPIEERPVPQSDVPGEKTSPTQSFPTRPPAYARNYDKTTGREVGAVLMAAPQSGSPMTYSIGGKQYIMVAISGGKLLRRVVVVQSAGPVISAFRLPFAALQAKQHTQTLAYIGNDVRGSLRDEHGSPSLPIEILHVIRENDPGDPAAGRQRHFERVSLHVTGNRAGNDEPSFRIVGARREDQSGTPPALLVTSLRIERQPDQIAGVRHVRASYHTSSPTGLPQSLSSWRFRGVILATSCLRE